MLNIWGVMLFIRMSWIVGQAGIGEHGSDENHLFGNRKFVNVPAVEAVRAQLVHRKQQQL